MEAPARLLAARTQPWLPLVVLPPVLVLDGALSTHGPAVSPAGVLAAVVACVPLLWRRRLPFLALAPLLVAGIVLVLRELEPGTTVVAIPAWALFDLALLRGGRQAVLAAALLPVCVVVSVIPFADDAGEAVSVVLRNLALCWLALAGGVLLRRTRQAQEREVAAAEADAQAAIGAERLRIAREVHDVVAHAMVAINVQSGVAAHRIEQDPEAAKEALLHIRRTSGDALTDLRATLGLLRDPDRPAPVAPAGLGDLEALAAPLRAAGVAVTLDVGVLGDVPVAVGAAAHRVVQEALTNVLRHARAAAATVAVRREGDALHVDVRDDGAAAAPADPDAPAGTGSGVRGMADRVAEIGGVLHAGPAAGGGWHVQAVLPLAAARVAAP